MYMKIVVDREKKMAEEKKRYDLNETEKKSRVREFFAKVFHGEYYKDTLMQMFRKDAIDRTVRFLNLSAECLADGDVKLQSEFKLACADILDNGKDAKESVEYIARQNEMASYCYWAFDKKRAEEHLEKANEMLDNLTMGVMYDAMEVLRSKGSLNLSFDEALDKMTATLLKREVEKVKNKVASKKATLKPKQKTEENEKGSR